MILMKRYKTVGFFRVVSLTKKNRKNIYKFVVKGKGNLGRQNIEVRMILKRILGI